MTWNKDQRDNQWRGVGHYILKARGRMEWTTTTIKGPRRVKRWEPWRTIARLGGPKAAAAEMEARKRRVGLEELAVFHDGRRLEPEQLAKLASETSAPEAPLK